MNVIVAWVLGAVFVTAWIASPADAVGLAGKIMRTGAVTVGAVVANVDEMVTGFNDAKKAAETPDKKKQQSRQSDRVQG